MVEHAPGSAVLFLAGSRRVVFLPLTDVGPELPTRCIDDFREVNLLPAVIPDGISNSVRLDRRGRSLGAEEDRPRLECL